MKLQRVLFSTVLLGVFSQLNCHKSSPPAAPYTEGDLAKSNGSKPAQASSRNQSAAEVMDDERQLRINEGQGFGIAGLESGNGQRCFSDLDCRFEWICQLGRCQQGCRSNQQCGPGSDCRNGRCNSNFNDLCSRNEDCRFGSFCQSGRCSQGGQGGFQEVCLRNEDCRLGSFCQSGRCSQGGAHGICSRNEDCRLGSYCQSGRCSVEVFGGSQGGFCRSDRECSFREVCFNYSCVSTCTSDRDCPGLLVCSYRNRVCVR